MSDFTSLRECEKQLLHSIHHGKDITKTIREFAAKAYQEGFKEGLLETHKNWWSQMDQDKAYIASCESTDAADNAAHWKPI